MCTHAIQSGALRYGEDGELDAALVCDGCGERVRELEDQTLEARRTAAYPTREGRCEEQV